MAGATLHGIPPVRGAGEFRGRDLTASTCNSARFTNVSPAFGNDKRFVRGRGRNMGRETAAVLRFSPSVANSPWRRVDNIRPSRREEGRGIPVLSERAVLSWETIGETELRTAYELEDRVRDYELDQYGVVNNAVYAQYCQNGRDRYMDFIGFNPDAVARSGNSMALCCLTVKFLIPLRSGDRYVVKTNMARTTAARIFIEQVIYKLPNREVVVECNSTGVFLNKNYRPTALPTEFKSKFLHFLHTQMTQSS